MKYVKPSSAFIALEECDEKYRAVIAEPRVPRDARSGKCIPSLTSNWQYVFSSSKMLNNHHAKPKL